MEQLVFVYEHVRSLSMPLPRLSTTPLGVSPASPTLLDSQYENEGELGCSGDGLTSVFDDVEDARGFVGVEGVEVEDGGEEPAPRQSNPIGIGATVGKGSDVVGKKQKLMRDMRPTGLTLAPVPSATCAPMGSTGSIKNARIPTKKLSKTILESLLLHEIRALDRLSHLKEATMRVTSGSGRVVTSTPRKEVEGWLTSESNGLDAARLLQSRLVLHTMCLQLLGGVDSSSKFRNETMSTLPPLSVDASGAQPMTRTNTRRSENENEILQMAVPESPRFVRVLPDVRLYLGSGSSAKDLGMLRRYGISYVVNVSAVVPNYHEGVRGVEATTAQQPSMISYVKVPVYDAEDVDIVGALKSWGALEFIQEGLDAGCGVLVHCCAGRSRSVACVCAYLVKRYGWRVEEALEVVGRVRVVRPNDGFMEQLRGFYDEVVGGG